MPVPDAKEGEVICAFVLLRDGCLAEGAPEAMLTWCRANLSAAAVPRYVQLLDPRSPVPDVATLRAEAIAVLGLGSPGRIAREAEALRENLLKRKTQARARQGG